MDANIRRYLRAHHSSAFLIGIVTLTVALVKVGTQKLAVPTVGLAGSVTFPLDRFLPLGFAIVAVGSLHSAMQSAERMATRRLHQYRTRQLVAIFILCASVIASARLYTNLPLLTPMRAYVAWFGLALISGSALSWRQCWVLPIASLFPLIYYGRDGNGHPRWWDISAAGAPNFPAAVVASVLFTLGILAFTASLWRFYDIRQALWFGAGRHRNLPRRRR